MADIISICREAWNASKREAQPVYDDLVESYRDMLTARAEGAIATGVSDDAPFQMFERAVIEQVAKAPDGLTEIEDIIPFKAEEPVRLESQGYAVIEPTEPPKVEAKGTITVEPESKSVTVNVTSVTKKKRVPKKKAVPKAPAKKPTKSSAKKKGAPKK